ncbi:taurine catabolism dioxygenase TauD [Solemya pervernicosa gill symbiont]|uniref:Taurine catabolism dioxygenase TauD n=2 Tax=Gammaproteobacteria incertae sedis TaxID=118884 RepID=A0A1T2L5M4_9GAMM|nr:TauD/TfdA family dioxygenase [Candidatus Reidiella endopervernicosa]OOZ40330.1 taurine catabolism dioxygenase TauD [Solemya pervernicosa gill symbiont]QKQ24855.1 TauD/TfdA family dioxygenase [Candidatus Reidiella endopervernicosa]
MSHLPEIPSDSPFSLASSEHYNRWRDAKLENYPTSLEQLVVQVANPRALTDAEYQAMLARLRQTNMVIYDGGTGDDPDKAIPRAIGERFGLRRMDANYLSDEDGITSLTVNPEGDHPSYIPYTNRAIRWHSDGYYNTEAKQIRSVMLHCVHPAAQGGENRLIDHEVAYIRLRDENPDYIHALMLADAMTIPPGKDAEGGSRGSAVGPVFSVEPQSGALHMRYTARKRNIGWSKEPLVQQARDRLELLLDKEVEASFQGRLESGMGLVCNNVLHDRAAFDDIPGASQRLLYRARYFDRVAHTGISDLGLKGL